MRICIITEPLIFNYGGILQNYALQTFLSKKGHEVYTFDVGRFNWWDWIINTLAITYHKLKGENVKYEKNPYQRKQLEKPLRRFVYDHIVLIKPRQYKLNTACLEKYHFDTLIVGSDQVWRPKYNHDIEDKFLLFARNLKIKRIAYAASFGSDEWEFTNEQTKTCKELIQKFDGVSVRELSGVKLCKEYLQYDAHHVLDPTLLLTKEDYISLCKNYQHNKPFVFAYILDYSVEKEADIRSFAVNMNIPLLFVRAEDKLSPNDRIEKWLSYFRDAKFVITDSFHGTAFSINFNKAFWVYGNQERGNARFSSLLKLFNLEKRLINKLPVKNENIDWNEVNKLLNNYRIKSSNWLINNLEQ